VISEYNPYGRRRLSFDCRTNRPFGREMAEIGLLK
jgi:hypothetical protein